MRVEKGDKRVDSTAQKEGSPRKVVQVPLSHWIHRIEKQHLGSKSAVRPGLLVCVAVLFARLSWLLAVFIVHV